MKSFSITRLKRRCAPWRYGNRWLEMKSFSITRLKHVLSTLDDATTTNLKWKASRLRDWNSSVVSAGTPSCWLEMKSFSITRLKLCSASRRVGVGRNLKWKASRLRDWNILDNPVLSGVSAGLEMKSFSITRLKHTRLHVLVEDRYHAWNEKLLDYEIETWWR